MVGGGELVRASSRGEDKRLMELWSEERQELLEGESTRWSGDGIGDGSSSSSGPGGVVGLLGLEWDEEGGGAAEI